MIIGIGGVSRAGKTSLALQIEKWYESGSVKILHQDDFIRPIEKMPLVKGHIDWEHPDSYDFVGLVKTIKKERKKFDIVVVEGLMVFGNQQLAKLMDKRIYIRISKEAFLSRKTLDNRWEDEPDWYIEHIWESHFVFGLVPQGFDHIMQLDGEAGFVDEIVQKYINN
jgi:uridine kinase